MKKLFIIPAVATVMFLASCGGSDTTTTESKTSTTETPAETPAYTPGSDIPGIADVAVTDHIELEGMDDMKYDKSLFKVKAGQEVKFTFKNVGKLPKEAMGHNVLVLKEGADVEAIALEAMKEKANDYIPQTDATKNEIIAHSKLLGPGESDTFTFTIAEPGVYEFICTFPGHHGTMKGKIVVE
ncbi:MAG: azurin [Ginsengibacter sp.]